MLGVVRLEHCEQYVRLRHGAHRRGNGGEKEKCGQRVPTRLTVLPLGVYMFFFTVYPVFFLGRPGTVLMRLLKDTIGTGTKTGGESSRDKSGDGSAERSTQRRAVRLRLQLRADRPGRDMADHTELW